MQALWGKASGSISTVFIQHIVFLLKDAEEKIKQLLFQTSVKLQDMLY